METVINIQNTAFLFFMVALMFIIYVEDIQENTKDWLKSSVVLSATVFALAALIRIWG